MSKLLKSNPAQDRFWMPAEFELHAGTWMLWPERPDNWRQNALPAQQAFTAVAQAIARFEPVTMGASRAQFQKARAALNASVRVVEISSDDAWARDTAPSFVVNAQGERRAVDWPFNAWGGLQGGLYESWEQDDLVAQKIAAIEGVDRYRAPLIMEGGAFHTDGQGTLLVTEQCLLNRNRNPKLSRAQIEKQLKAYLGVSTIIWLGEGVVDDETDGHIDDLACFIRPGVVCLTYPDNRRDAQWKSSQNAWERLHDARDALGRRLQVHQLPSPGPLKRTRREASGVEHFGHGMPRQAGERLTATYVNFYLANGAVIAPLLDSRTDGSALRKLRALFPRRKVVGVPSREILLGGGNIHCITQQLPAPHRRQPVRPSAQKAKAR